MIDDLRFTICILESFQFVEAVPWLRINFLAPDYDIRGQARGQNKKPATEF